MAIQPDFRTGFGFDVHRFSEKGKLFLGGVEIKYNRGLKGHSDADVLLHSLCDALLGAAGKKDIGNQFPNTDNKFKNISSLILIKETFELLQKDKWMVINTDSVIILEEPKIYAYTDDMVKNISKIIGTDNISIKATTSEGLGYIGKKKGCAAYTSVLICR